MSEQGPVYIGVSPLIPHPSYCMVVLDGGLHLLEKAEGSLEEILTFIMAKDEATVALNFPRRPNQGMANAVKAGYTGRGRPPLHGQDKRLCEAVLQRMGIKVVYTPAEMDKCPLWMRQGFVFFERLEEAGFTLFLSGGASRAYFETCAEGIFHALLGQGLLPQRSLEGRLQRQLVVFDKGMRIADPMDFFEEITRYRLLQGNLPLQKLYSLSDLDGMAAAYMAWLTANNPQQISQVGDPLEGCLILPYFKELENQPQAESRQMSIFN